MFEKVNPSHPDKVADRIAGALVDLAYRDSIYPKIAVEVLIGHGKCHIIAETSVILDEEEVRQAVTRIAGDVETDIVQVSQDDILARNQVNEIRCGDNGIFKGVPTTAEQREMSKIARFIYDRHPNDGKYILDGDNLIVCQSNTERDVLRQELADFNKHMEINPLGDWTGGTNVDTGATNRKLGSDMGDAVTGGGLHGKDLSKADVSLNIYAFLKAQITGKPVELYCAIGDEEIDGRSYSEIVKVAKAYIEYCGGFEEFAEWGLI